MKKTAVVLASFPLIALSGHAAVTLGVQAGTLLNSSSTPVSDTSLWAIVYDQNGDGILPGGLAADSNLTNADASQILADFANQTISSGGTIGLDRILWSGAVDGIGTSGAESIGGHDLNGDGSGFTFADLGVAANGKWAVYWFPGLSEASNTLSGPTFEVGGLQRTTSGSGGDIGMAMPSTDTPGGSFSAYFIDATNGGVIADSAFTAVAIPETSTLTLSALGMAALLRRRRR